MGLFSAIQGVWGSLPLQHLRSVAAKSTVQEAKSILATLPRSVVQNAEVDLRLESGFAKAVFTGGATLLCVAGITYLWNTYGGSSLRRKHFNGKSKVKDTCLVQYEAGKEEDAEELLYDPEWCLPPGSLWCEVAGDAWSRGEGVPFDPHYGLPPWMEGGAGVEETEDESLSWEEDFNLPAGVLWADISPVEDLVLEAPYQLQEDDIETTYNVSIPAGVLWADISPVEDLVLEAPYQLQEDDIETTYNVSLPAGVLWADISPVEDLVLEAPYQLQEDDIETTYNVSLPAGVLWADISPVEDLVLEAPYQLQEDDIETTYDVSLPAGVLWADISPVEDLVLEAPYQLQEDDIETTYNVWGLELIEEEEEV